MTDDACRAPHGACGLKCFLVLGSIAAWESRPAWGVWIEMALCPLLVVLSKSRPAWGVWIEMFYHYWSFRPACVAPRMGRVD